MNSKYQIPVIIGILLVFMLLNPILFSSNQDVEVSYKSFRDSLQAGRVDEVQITGEKIFGRFKLSDSAIAAMQTKEAEKPTDLAERIRLGQLFENTFKKDMRQPFVVIALPDEKLVEDLQKYGVNYKGVIDSNWLENLLLYWVFPLILLFFVWGFIFRRMGGGANVMNIGKNKARIYAADTKTRVTFEDVAGVEEVIEEVREIVDFLKNPKKYTKLGAKIPKGVLLVGPPGTGKTLLAKAVAGEANVPFFSLSGSDFVEMFVGVGASRVRDLFAEAKSKAPCIIFIDEIDAIGRSRAKGFVMGGHDERENTLNQLLVEMDGFNTDKGVIIMGATNRPDVLDSALLRPGRFDRQVVLDRPDLKARVDIFNVHTKGMPLAADLDIKSLAAQTPGFAGAEIANVCNEASLLASRKDKERIEMSDFQEAIERVIGGLEKKNKIISPRERVIVAYHESGHAVVGHYLENADPVHKVSIVPRGIGALGYTLQTPLEDRYLLSKDELIERMCSLLGGRAAEDIVLGKVSTGASNDLERVTEIANRMVTMYGMSDKLGNLSFTEQGRENFLGGVNMKPYSEETAKLIDSEVKSIVDMAYEKTKQLLIDRREELEALTQRLLEKEVLDKKQIEEILGEKPVPENNGHVPKEKTIATPE
ncbi:ATP-dependent zinc metalloprotease FtsH [bacterium]|nr:ATP-dependent zinc metalloprotease FtsH [bacterium]NUN46192.1 ATP-dependent metallopeptidase FtsH/Yme1/Tma family protein [bacterium]